MQQILVSVYWRGITFLFSMGKENLFQSPHSLQAGRKLQISYFGKLFPQDFHTRAIQIPGVYTVTRRSCTGYQFKEVTTGPVDTQVQQFCHSHHNEMLESGASHLTAQLLLQPQRKGSSVSIECCQGSGLGSCSPRTYKHSSILRLPRHSTSFSYQLFHTNLLVTPRALVFETQSSQSVLQSSFFLNFSSF